MLFFPWPFWLKVRRSLYPALTLVSLHRPSRPQWYQLPSLQCSVCFSPAPNLCTPCASWVQVVMRAQAVWSAMLARCSESKAPSTSTGLNKWETARACSSMQETARVCSSRREDREADRAYRGLVVTNVEQCQSSETTWTTSRPAAGKSSGVEARQSC